MRQLEYAVEINERLSFRRAAEHCHVSQPALSAQLLELEEQLGVRLFERDRKKVLPTRAGQEILERARKVLAEADALWETAVAAQDPFAGTMRIGVIPTVSPYLLPELTPRLLAAYPRLRIGWVEDKTEALLRQLEAGVLEAALIALPTEAPHLERAKIGLDPFCLVAPIGHPLAKKKGRTSLAELGAADVLLLDEGHCLREQALSFCQRARAKELEFRATSLSTLVQMVAGGAGVTLLPAMALPTETQRAKLVVRHFQDPSPARTIVLVWRPHSPLRAALQALGEVIQQTAVKRGMLRPC
ncbi:MAG: LysR substrate-binding domain-containing protein [Myxococcota bacterium]